MSKQHGPLEDIRIVELGHVIAGPLSATLMADFGADVIKVEHPRGGDMMRDLGPKAKQDGVGVWWKTIARNKRILSLNWKADEGRAILRKLVEQADVLVENFRAGVLERGGIGPDVLHEWNPDLIILRISGYGQSGPMAKKSAFGRAAEAMAGMPHITSYENGPCGQVVDLAVFEALMRLMDYPVPALSGAKLSPKRNGLRQPMDFAPGGMFRTLDGTWVTVSAANPQTAQRLLRAVSGDALAGDPRFADMPAITKNMAAFFDTLNAFIAKTDLADVEAAFEAADAVATPVLSVEDILAHPQINHRGDIATIEGEETRVIGLVPKLSETPGSMRWLGREENADSRTILQELGYEVVEIETLAAQGIIGLPEGKA